MVSKKKIKELQQKVYAYIYDPGLFIKENEEDGKIVKELFTREEYLDFLIDWIFKKLLEDGKKEKTS